MVGEIIVILRPWTILELYSCVPRYASRIYQSVRATRSGRVPTKKWSNDLILRRGRERRSGNKKIYRSNDWSIYPINHFVSEHPYPSIHPLIYLPIIQRSIRPINIQPYVYASVHPTINLSDNSSPRYLPILPPNRLSIHIPYHPWIHHEPTTHPSSIYKYIHPPMHPLIHLHTPPLIHQPIIHLSTNKSFHP